MKQDTRWIQRFNNFRKSIENLTEAVQTASQRKLNNLEEQGLIKAFELAHELSWLTIKDYYENQGEVSIQGSRDAFRLAFKRGLIENGDAFMQSILSRQLSVQTYDEETAEKLHFDIVNTYFKEFEKLSRTLDCMRLKEE